MYLRSGKLKQPTINFPCRKRRQEAGSKEQDSYSSTKRTTSIPSKTQKLRSGQFSDLTGSLHCSIPATPLLCRDEELKEISSFLQTSITTRRPGSLYISGTPGTGKTACLSHAMENSEDLLKSVVVVMLNCMSVQQPQAIFGHIAECLLDAHVPKAQHQEALLKSMTTSRKMILIVLDELDQLDKKEILYTLFEWPTLPNSRLILIGIANTLNLGFLPRLHMKCQPQLLHFPPYTKEQIAKIVQNRLGNNLEGTQTVVDPMAIEFIARKIASVNGDIRKALDVCRRAIELAKNKKTRCQKSEKNSEPPLRVTVSVMSEVYTSNSTAQNTMAIPLQQKLVICTLCVMVRGQAKKEVTLEKLHEAYARLCQQRHLKFESETEFVGLCDMLATNGIIALKKTKAARLTKVTLKLEEDATEHLLEDHTLSSVLRID